MPDTLAVVRPTRVYLLDFFCSGIQLYVLLSPYLFFISFLYLDLYVLGDDQASKYLKIGTCPASQNLLADMGKISFQ